jgi:hypothetical protein
MTGDIPVFVAIVACTCAIALWQGARYAVRYFKTILKARSNPTIAVQAKSKAASSGTN